MKASLPEAAGDEGLMEASDELPSDFEIDDSQDDSEGEEDEEMDADDDELSLMEGSDNEDLISLDGDIPDGLIEYHDSDAEEDEEEEWEGINSEEGSGSKKRKRVEIKSERRKKLRSLPTFASYEDYAKMIKDGPDDVL
jgi:ribosome biogenesis protein MAK21